MRRCVAAERRSSLATPPRSPAGWPRSAPAVAAGVAFRPAARRPLAREQVGGDRDEALRGELIRDRADPVREPEYLVDHDDDRSGILSLGIYDPDTHGRAPHVDGGELGVARRAV